MSVTKTKFKSSLSEKRWVDLQKEKIELQGKKMTPVIQEKIDTLSSLMTACKVGFNLPEAKVKKICKFLREYTGKEKVKYGALPEGHTPQSILFKEIVILYVDKDSQVLFKENEK